VVGAIHAPAGEHVVVGDEAVARGAPAHEHFHRGAAAPPGNEGRGIARTDRGGHAAILP